MLAVVFAVSLIGVRYEHPQVHFTVDLPKEWVVADPKDDPTGVILQRATDDRLTICSIHATQVGDMALADYVLAIAAASQGERGYTRLASGPVTLAGTVGHRLRFTQFIDEKGEFTKTVEERIVIIDGVGYVVRVEGFTPWFKKRSSDVAHLFDTFAVPAAPTTKAEPAPGKHVQPCPFNL